MRHFPPHRIVCLTEETVETLYLLGDQDRIVGVSGYAVRPGQRVALGERIAAMGSTGRSTGTHLHYEVWVNGRAQNPGRFLKAGQYVLQAD
jgi:murein DD-endopeptidase MepM/ murein hydrolase activator NlpD